MPFIHKLLDDTVLLQELLLRTYNQTARAECVYFGWAESVENPGVKAALATIVVVVVVVGSFVALTHSLGTLEIREAGMTVSRNVTRSRSRRAQAGRTATAEAAPAMITVDIPPDDSEWPAAERPDEKPDEMRNSRLAELPVSRHTLARGVSWGQDFTDGSLERIDSTSRSSSAIRVHPRDSRRMSTDI